MKSESVRKVGKCRLVSGCGSIRPTATAVKIRDPYFWSAVRLTIAGRGTYSATTPPNPHHPHGILAAARPRIDIRLKLAIVFRVLVFFFNYTIVVEKKRIIWERRSRGTVKSKKSVSAALAHLALISLILSVLSSQNFSWLLFRCRNVRNQNMSQRKIQML